MLIVGGSGSWQTNALLYLILHQQDKNLNELKYQLIIKKCKNAGLKHYNDSKDFNKALNY